MPFKWKCTCGKALDQSNDIKIPDEVLSKFDGRCPKCRKKLSTFPKDVRIALVEKNARIGGG